MKISPTQMTVADYCTAMNRSEIVVNRRYQRSDKVWPPAAKSFLIETILLDYPMPKLSLSQVTDLKTRKTYKEIVDGQQRSAAIREFFNDDFALSRSVETEDLVGKKFSELDDESKSRFLEYSLGVDLFLSATPPEVVEIFRRMNSYTIPLNPEEHRHASFQGPFKWFIASLAKRSEAVFLSIGLFTEKQLVRMADAKLLTEICHALFHGIRTTNRRMLDQLYRSRDQEFKEQPQVDGQITNAVNTLQELTSVHSTSLIRPHIAYSLLLAMIHVTHKVPLLQEIFPVERGTHIGAGPAAVALSALASGLDEEDETYRKFIAACTDRTNVKEQREIRFRWLCRALMGGHPA